MKRPRGTWLRAGLLFVAAGPLVVGTWALFAPRSFFEGFPAAGRHWVSALGPFNEHLTRDVGALNLALGLLLVIAAALLGKRLVRASLAAWLVYAVPHLVFHLSEYGALSPLDDLVNVGVLTLAVLLPLLLLAVSPRAGGDDAAPSRRTRRRIPGGADAPDRHGL